MHRWRSKVVRLKSLARGYHLLDLRHFVCDPHALTHVHQIHRVQTNTVCMAIIMEPCHVWGGVLRPKHEVPSCPYASHVS